MHKVLCSFLIALPGQTQFVIVTDVNLANEVLRSGLDKAPVYKAFDRVRSPSK
jgi:hypothetical protein